MTDAYNPAYVPSGPANKDNPYNKKINNVRLAKGDESKSEYRGTVGGVAPSGALELIGSEANGLSIDFTDNTCVIRDTITPANNYNNKATGKLTIVGSYSPNAEGFLTGTTSRASLASSLFPIMSANCSLYVEFKIVGLPGAIGTLVAYNNSTDNNRVTILMQASAIMQEIVSAVAVEQANIPSGLAITTNVVARSACRAAANNAQGCTGGALGIADAVVTMPTATPPSVFVIGSARSGSSNLPFFGYIRKILALPRVLSDAELQHLTLTGSLTDAPANTVAPVITGILNPGSLLTCNPGTWTGFPVPVLTQQWYADIVAIAGATALTYTLTPAEVAKLMQCRVIGTNSEGFVQANSNILGPVTGSEYDKYWPAVMYAMYGLSGADDWNGVSSPAVTDVTALLTGSGNENCDKAGIVWPTTSLNYSPIRKYLGAFDGTTGKYTSPNSSNTIITIATFAAGDWTTVGATGTFNFDGTAGAVTKTRSEWYLHDGAQFNLVDHCPMFDLPASSAVWTASDNNALKMQAAIPNYNTKGGHGLHFVAYWHKGGAYWFHHSLWNLTAEADIKKFIATYMHWNISTYAQHFIDIGVQVINVDCMNEMFDEDIDISSSTKEPGLRGWARTFPAYTIEASSLHYAATLCPSLGAANIDRILQLHQYCVQTIRKYFPNVRSGYNDFGWEGRRYTNNTLQVSTPDVNGNTANQTVWVGHQQGQKQLAVEYWVYRILSLPQTAIILDAILDAGAVWAPLDAMGCQLHAEPKNQFKLDALEFMFNRMSHLNGGDFEFYISEANARGEHTLTQTPGSVNITGGVAGDTITSVFAAYPTTQTVTGNELLASPIAWTTSNAGTATLVAAGINVGTATHGYKATVDGTTNTKVNLERDPTFSQRGFDVTSAKTGTVTLTNVNSRVNNPSNVPPQFRQYYKTSKLTTQRTSWSFGWNDTNKDYWNYGAWILESVYGTSLRQSYIRQFKWWTPSGGLSGNPVSLWDYSYNKIQNYYTMKDILPAQPFWKTPGLRVIKNAGRIDFTWYKALILTQSGVTVDTNGFGTVINGISGENSHPWTWWGAQDIVANDFGAVISWTAPAANPPVDTVIFSSGIDANNYVELYFNNTSGAVSLRSVVGGIEQYDIGLGLHALNANNVVAFTIDAAGASASLNGAATINGVGSCVVGTKVNVGFSVDNIDGYSGAKFLVLDMYSKADIGALPTASVVPQLTNPWPLWLGSPATTIPITEDN